MFRLPALIALTALLSVQAFADRRTITVNEAQDLVRALLKPDGWTKLHGFVLYQALFDSEFQDFYFIHAEWDSPSGKHVPIGHFAVERTTGDVWDWVKCGQFNSASLAAAQQALRKRIGLSEQDYLRIKKRGPFCEPNEQPQTMQMGKPKTR